jgi:hypothetical protein
MVEHSTAATSAVRPNEPARQVIATFGALFGLLVHALQLLASGNRKE